jgi:nicotinamide-nucleotide amidase
MADRMTDRAAALLGARLRSQARSVAVAESCTGGLLAGAITAVPGSSDYFLGGVIAYHNDVKTAALGVPAPLIARRGAVSEEVAIAMAEGVLRRFKADVAIATTGVAGPGGGTRDKPVGTVWVAVVLRGGVRHAHRFRFRGGREAVRRETVRASLAAVAEAMAGKER